MPWVSTFVKTLIQRSILKARVRRHGITWGMCVCVCVAEAVVDIQSLLRETGDEKDKERELERGGVRDEGDKREIGEALEATGEEVETLRVERSDR